METKKIVFLHGNASLVLVSTPETGIEPMWPHKCVDTQRPQKKNTLFKKVPPAYTKPRQDLYAEMFTAILLVVVNRKQFMYITR